MDHRPQAHPGGNRIPAELNLAKFGELRQRKFVVTSPSSPLKPPPLRVLTFLHSFAPGGVEHTALRLHAAWNNDGADSRLVFGRGNGVMRAEWPGLDAEILSSGRFSTARWETLWMIARLPGVIRRLRPDVLFCAGNTYAIVAVMMKLLLGRGCPPIVAKISNDLVRMDMPAPVRAGYRVWLRIQGRLLDQLVGMAPPMRAEIAQLMRPPQDRIAIIDDPSLDEADIERLAQARSAALKHCPDARAGRRFLAIGRLTSQKTSRFCWMPSRASPAPMIGWRLSARARIGPRLRRRLPASALASRCACPAISARSMPSFAAQTRSFSRRILKGCQPWSPKHWRRDCRSRPPRAASAWMICLALAGLAGWSRSAISPRLPLQWIASPKRRLIGTKRNIRRAGSPYS